MERIVYELRDNNSYWSVAQFMPYPKSQMHLLQMSFNKLHDWITVEFQGNQVIIWDLFDENHDSWENISKLYLSKENYDQVIKEWNENAKNPAKYLVFVRDNNGRVKLEPKSKLSEDDLQAIQEDKKAKIEYENRN